MKPDDWDQMSEDAKQTYALNLFSSMRGRYIISQALHYGIKALNEIPDPYKEQSNIEDMETLRELFSFPIFEPDRTSFKKE